MLRNRRKPINELINNNRITTKQWEDHFQKLYDDATEGEQQTLENIEEEDQGENWTMTKGTIKAAIQKLKNRKAPGPDEIKNEMIKYGGDTLVEELSPFLMGSLCRGESRRNGKSA